MDSTWMPCRAIAFSKTDEMQGIMIAGFTMRDALA